MSSIPRKNLQTAFTGDQDTPTFTRRTHVFKSQGTKCEGWLYLPKGGSLPPVVLMAHGESTLLALVPGVDPIGPKSPTTTLTRATSVPSLHEAAHNSTLPNVFQPPQHQHQLPHCSSHAAARPICLQEWVRRKTWGWASMQRPLPMVAWQHLCLTTAALEAQMGSHASGCLLPGMLRYAI
jgi:hypothetical protein